MHALSNSLANDQEMTKENVELGFLGKDLSFRKLTEVEIENYLQNVETKKPSRNIQVRYRDNIELIDQKHWCISLKILKYMNFLIL